MNPKFNCERCENTGVITTYAQHGQTTELPGGGLNPGTRADCPNCHPHVARRWSEYWTTKDGTRLMWGEIETRHLWNIAQLLALRARSTQRLHDDDIEFRRHWHAKIDRRYAQRLAQHPERAEHWGRRRNAMHAVASWSSLDSQRRTIRKAIKRMRAELCRAIDELDYRSELPSWDDLRIAWDRACGGEGGPNVADDPEQRPWCLIELWVGFRGEPTASAEWQAQLDESPDSH